MQYPRALIPIAYEEIRLLTGGIVNVPKAMPRFKPWLGAPLKDTYGGKQVIDSNGEPVFAELAILRILQVEGWQGAWIDTYRNRKRIAIDQFIELPPDRNELLNKSIRALVQDLAALMFIAGAIGRFYLLKLSVRGTIVFKTHNATG